MQSATPNLEDEQVQVLLQATGRQTVTDALLWIAERRQLRGRRDRLLVALVAATELQLPQSVEALRVISRQALNCTLDTSADLLATSTITPPHRYQQALAAIADRTTGTSLSNITVEAVGAAQNENSLVIEALALTAGLSYRDLCDRASARGTTLPGESQKPWKHSQVRAAFEVIDQVVQGTGTAQLNGAVAARPLELLLPGTTGWEAIEALRTGGVSYGTLLAQRDVGSAWGAHRNRTNNEVSRLMVRSLLDALDSRGVTYWSTEGPAHVSKPYLAGKALTSGEKPGQLTVVTRGADGAWSLAVLVAVARDGGTARKSAATVLKLREFLKIPGAAVLVGTGWASRGESDDLIRAFKGRVFNEQSLDDLAELAAERTGLSDPPARDLHEHPEKWGVGLRRGNKAADGPAWLREFGQARGVTTRKGGAVHRCRLSRRVRSATVPAGGRWRRSSTPSSPTAARRWCRRSGAGCRARCRRRGDRPRRALARADPRSGSGQRLRTAPFAAPVTPGSHSEGQPPS